MPVRFAAARSPALSPVARALAVRRIPAASNDVLGGTTPIDAITAAALRHFAAHGLGAGATAEQKADGALAAGDRAAFEHWLGICRTLDRKRGDLLASRAQALAATA